MSEKSPDNKGKSQDELLEALYRQAEEAVERTKTGQVDAVSDEVEVEDTPDDESERDVRADTAVEEPSPAAAAELALARVALEAVTARVDALEKDKRDGNERYLRLMADLENLRKRSRREVDEAKLKAKEDTLREVLTVLDNLDRALASVSDQITVESLLQGVQMVHRQFVGVLERLGAQAFDSIGQPFDPTRHEALSQIETPEHPPGSVAAEMQKGYTLGTRLIRPAFVAVAKAPTIVTQPSSTAEASPIEAAATPAAETEASTPAPATEASTTPEGEGGTSG